jgi:hypothetical protein
MILQQRKGSCKFVAARFQRAEWNLFRQHVKNVPPPMLPNPAPPFGVRREFKP